MHVLRVRNVQEAYVEGMSLLAREGVQESSRAGDVLVVPCPVATVYERPWERVLRDPVRDANPFFHLMESVWMLAGSSNARWLDTYVRDFSSRFAEGDGHIWGAYGKRWRAWGAKGRESAFGRLDQLIAAASVLAKSPGSRQAVITMWNPLWDLGASKRDIPCNTHVYLRGLGTPETGGLRLDYTVCCRSNDIVWGAYGANAVHMSVMGELLAALAGMLPGRYTQMSNNWHGYTAVLDGLTTVAAADDYETGSMVHMPIIPDECQDVDRRRSVAIAVLKDCERMVSSCTPREEQYETEWFDDVVEPVAWVHWHWREGRRQEAVDLCDMIEALDWRVACREWMQRRMS